jgi:lysophospholipid acyltransferase (LPLAT)-like uncharacterized protein
MRLLKRILGAPAIQKAIGVTAAGYLRAVYRTSAVQTVPADIYERIVGELPVIIAMWHGQHFMMPFVRRPEHRVKVLVSRHRDGEINAIAAERLGIGTIRGSGSHGGDHHRKGGVGAYREMLDALNDGFNVALTADVPKVSRVAGMGIVKLARDSGRMIYPVALTSSRRIVLDNWDRTTINLPFGRGASVAGAPIHVPANADSATVELARSALEEALNAATLRAYELADGSAGDHNRG